MDDTDPANFERSIRDRRGACVPGVCSRTEDEDERRMVDGGDMSRAAGGGEGVWRVLSGDSILGRVGTGMYQPNPCIGVALLTSRNLRTHSSYS